MVPILSSNYLASISNFLEATKKTERPWRTKPVKTNLNHAILVCVLLRSSWHKNAWSQKPLSWLVSATSSFPMWASSPDPSGSSMGINTYCHMMQMSLGMEIKCIGWSSTLAGNGGSSRTDRMVKLDIFLNMEAFTMLLVIFRHRWRLTLLLLCRGLGCTGWLLLYLFCRLARNITRSRRKFQH